MRKLTTGDAHVKLLFLHENEIDVHLGKGTRLLAKGSEKLLQQQENKTTQDVTQASEAEELSRLPSTNMPPYQRGDHEAKSGAVDNAEGSVKRDFIVARLGERAGGGDRKGERSWEGEEEGHFGRSTVYY